MIKREIQQEISQRVEFIRGVLSKAKAQGIVFGNSGGKDCALVGILCKMACENTLGVIMPCDSKRNYNQDKEHAEVLARLFDIETRVVDLTQAKKALADAVEFTTQTTAPALTNIAPRLRMTTLYAVAASENRIVAGTSNRSEVYMGYFTKWGDGACDFNPIADLTVTEVYEFLRFLNVPQSIIEKAPSGGLFDGQTDESEMGISYKSIDNYLQGLEVEEHERQIIESYHSRSIHKREKAPVFGEQ
jgi:NAD+ synthase